MANKTQEITGKLEQVLDNVEFAVTGLYGTIKAINFGESLSDNSIEKLRLHLGYAKTYSELAKTRLIYSRVEEYERHVSERPAKRAKIDSTRVEVTEAGTISIRSGGRKATKPPRKTTHKD